MHRPSGAESWEAGVCSYSSSAYILEDILGIFFIDIQALEKQDLYFVGVRKIPFHISDIPLELVNHAELQSTVTDKTCLPGRG